MEITDKAQWEHIVSIADTFSTETRNAIMETTQGKDFSTLHPQSGKSIKSLIYAHSPYSTANKRYMKRYPNGLSPEIVQEIIKV